MVNLGIQAVRGKPADGARYHRQARFVVDGRFPLGQDDESRARLVEARVHTRRDLGPAGERQADMNAVRHMVRLERAADLADDLLLLQDLFKGHRFRRSAEPVQVLEQPENPSVRLNSTRR